MGLFGNFSQHRRGSSQSQNFFHPKIILKFPKQPKNHGKIRLKFSKEDLIAASSSTSICLGQVFRERWDDIQNPEPYSVSTGAKLPGRTSSLPGSVAVDGLLCSEIMPPFHLQPILWNNSLLSKLSYSLQATISKQESPRQIL